MRLPALLSTGLLIGLAAIAPVATGQTPQGTAFTYQGELRQNGGPVTGNTDMVFELYDAPVGGNPVGAPLSFTAGNGNPVAVANGIFSVPLDFGALAFNQLGSDERYLKITVNGNVLSPRTKIENAPYALQSRTAELAYSVSNASVGAAQIVPAQVQRRVTGACASGSNIQSIAENGTVTCQADANSGGTLSGVIAGSGLSGGGTSGDVTLAIANPLQLEGTDPNGVLTVQNGAASGAARAITATSGGDSGATIRGNATSATGNGPGVAGLAVSPSANGVQGQSSATSGAASGVYGLSTSPGGNGVFGWANSTTGDAWGTGGASNSPDGAGAAGYNYATTGVAHGVRGVTTSTEGIAVLGQSTATSGSTTGVFGQVSSPNGNAVQGVAYDADTGTGVSGAGPSYGVYGYSAKGTGVAGDSSAATGVGVSGYGSASSGANTGVLGVTYSGTGTGVRGTAPGNTGSAYGVYGSAYSSSAAAVGVYGAGSNGSTGVVAWSGSTGYGLSAYSLSNSAVNAKTDGSSGISAVHAYSSNGYGLNAEGYNIGAYAHNLSGTPGRDAYLATSSLAGDFYGNVFVHGTLFKSAGSFKIDHPLDPANKYLVHSFVESPDMKNVYDGVATLDARGEAWVELPGYFEALNRDFRYQLTALDQAAPSLHVARRIEGNRFRIAGGGAGQQVSWQVTGTRRDAYAEAHRIVPEVDKADDERGRYLMPDLFGQPDSKSLKPQRPASPEGASATPMPQQSEPVAAPMPARPTASPPRSPTRPLPRAGGGT